VGQITEMPTLFQALTTMAKKTTTTMTTMTTMTKTPDDNFLLKQFWTSDLKIPLRSLNA